MDISQIAKNLANKDFLFLKFVPNNKDFTRSDYGGTLSIYSQSTLDEVYLPIPQPHFGKFVGLLSFLILGEGKTVVTFGIKEFMTFLKFKMGMNYKFDFSAKIIDLKYLQLFLGKQVVCPDNLSQSLKLVAELYPQVKNVHTNIHLPLALDVLPSLETKGSIVNMETKKKSYLYYDIEGQKNGRLNSEKVGDDFINLHNAGEEVKKLMKPGLDNDFLVADFKAAEVCVLGKISGDKKLGKIIDSGRDIYQTIGQLCGISDRKKVKSSFLKFIYGAGTDLIAEKDDMSLTEASDLLNSYKVNFPTAFGYLDECYKQAREGHFKDYFGRTRFYETNHHAAKNAAIQGPTAIICQEKSILLSKMYLVGIVHDGYYFSIPKNKFREAAVTICEMLEQESRMLSGLRMKIDLKTGDTLGSLNDYSL